MNICAEVALTVWFILYCFVGVAGGMLMGIAKTQNLCDRFRDDNNTLMKKASIYLFAVGSGVIFGTGIAIAWPIFAYSLSVYHKDCKICTCEKKKIDKKED